MSASDHGTVSTYTNHKCRCDACREAQRLYMRGWYSRNREHRTAYMREYDKSRKAVAS